LDLTAENLLLRPQQSERSLDKHPPPQKKSQTLIIIQYYFAFNLRSNQPLNADFVDFEILAGVIIDLKITLRCQIHVFSLLNSL
jgi:hypothetical protein